jgi:hypothetical protein
MPERGMAFNRTAISPVIFSASLKSAIAPVKTMLMVKKTPPKNVPVRVFIVMTFNLKWAEASISKRTTIPVAAA